MGTSVVFLKFSLAIADRETLRKCLACRIETLGCLFFVVVCCDGFNSGTRLQAIQRRRNLWVIF